MALRDVRNFQFFKEAIVQRFRNPGLKSFRGIPYEPQINSQTIFGRIYSTFRELIGKGLNLHQYLNIGERSVLENLYRNLQSDTNLRFLNKPDATLNDPRLELSDQYFQEQPKAVAAAQQTADVPTATSAASGLPSISTRGISPGISIPPQRIIVMPKEEAVPSTAPIATAPTPTTTPAVSAISPSGSTAPNANSSFPSTPTQPVTTSSSRFNFSTLKSRASSFTSPLINKVSASAGPSIKKGLEGIGRGITGAGRAGLGTATPALGRMGNGLLNGIQRISQPGGIGGGRISKLSKSSNKLAFGLIGGLIFFVLISGVIGGLGGTTPTGEAAPLPPGTSSDLDKKYDFTAFNIFKSDAVDDSLLQKYTDKALTNSKVKTDEQKNLIPSRAKFIRDQAQLAGLNPAIFLGYWESESGFSDYTYPGVRPGSDLGCDPLNPALKTFEDSVLCAVGKSQITNSRTSQCAVSKDINSTPCQTISFQQKEGVKLPISTLTDFLNSYGSKVADPNNLRSDNIVKQTIADLGLVPTINTPPSSSTPYTPGGGSGILSCPVNNGSVIYGSKETGGHCSSEYGFNCIKPGQPGYTGRETAIDVKGSDRTVFLPLLSGNSVEWTIDESGTPINDSEGGGIAVAATALSGNKTYRIRFVHLEATDLKIGQKVNSATPVGQHVLPSIDRRSFANHIHITIQEDGVYKPADLYFNLCK